MLRGAHSGGNINQAPGFAGHEDYNPISAVDLMNPSGLAFAKLGYWPGRGWSGRPRETGFALLSGAAGTSAATHPTGEHAGI